MTRLVVPSAGASGAANSQKTGANQGMMALQMVRGRIAMREDWPLGAQEGNPAGVGRSEWIACSGAL